MVEGNGRSPLTITHCPLSVDSLRYLFPNSGVAESPESPTLPRYQLDCRGHAKRFPFDWHSSDF